MTTLAHRRGGELPAHMYGRRRPTPIDPLVGEVLRPGEEPAVTAEDVARAWLLGFDNENTLRVYGYALVDWFAFCADADVDPLQARRPLVEAWKEAMYDRGRSPKTVSARLSTLSSFYAYAEDEEAVRRSPVRGVRRPKLPDQSSSTGLTREELNAFLAEARRRGPQMHALMVLLGLNGLRATEPTMCDVEDLGTERGHRTLSVTRKGKDGKVRVPLAPMTARALDTWLEERAAALGQLGKGTGLLFFKVKRGEHGPSRIDRRDVHRYVRAIGAEAVPDKPSLHPHDLRHAFVTLALDAGVPLRDVQDSAGHASPTTTRRYDQNRGKVDRHATYTLAAYLGGTEEP
ncbi:MAG: tyrosine-type recombinase/integrase [Actinobacteria bacterium]|nr:tyrosine-type recombinase/integrase [Actinomycetota bacterium]